MANTPASIPSTPWETALAAYRMSCDALDHAETLRLTAEEQRDDAEEALLRTPVPDLDALATKLEAMWADNFIMNCSPIVDVQRQILTDLRRFAATLS